jgi:malate dehydrogenase
MTDQFEGNAPVVKELAEAISKHCTDPFIFIITNPVNSLVPLVAEILNKSGKFNPRKLFGITTIDVVRAATFAAELDSGISASELVVPVVGGHSNKTIVPLYSLANPPLHFDEQTMVRLALRTQLAGDGVMEAKGGTSATMCMAYAALKYVLMFLIPANL